MRVQNFSIIYFTTTSSFLLLLPVIIVIRNLSCGPCYTTSFTFIARRSPQHVSILKSLKVTTATTTTTATKLQFSKSNDSSSSSSNKNDEATIEDQNLSSALSSAYRSTSSSSSSSPINDNTPSPNKKPKKSKTSSSSSSSQPPDQSSSSSSLPMVPAGTASDIFAMARRMLLWNPPDASPSSTSNNTLYPPPKPLPRWHPVAGISDTNPSFRSSPPPMTSLGYYNMIRRNSRKRNKPSLWRYALKTYRKMNVAMTRAGHAEGAMVACAKLGDWRNALEIWRGVEERVGEGRRGWKVTDNMALALVKASVRGVRMERSAIIDDGRLDARREGLDVVREVLCTMEEKHGIPLIARHVNPLASAYQYLNLHAEAELLLHSTLTNHPQKQKKRSSSSRDDEDDDDDDEYDDDDDGGFDVNDIRAKNAASHSLLIKGAIMEDDWVKAVEGLRDMTADGVYPKKKDLNEWAELGGRMSRKRGRKKKREANWIQN